MYTYMYMLYIHLELETLDLYGNNLDRVPDEIWSLVHLVRLDLGGMVSLTRDSLKNLKQGNGRLINVFKLFS